MSVNKKEALELAKRVEGYINSDTLTENEKETIVSEAAAAYDENINSGWIPLQRRDVCGQAVHRMVSSGG